MKCLDTTFLIDIVEHPDETRGLAEDLEGRGDVLATTVFNIWEALLGAHSVRMGQGAMEWSPATYRISAISRP